MSTPFVIVSVAQSLDGYIDDPTPARLILSNDEDFDEVDGLRAGVDAILVGAGAVRKDNPRLMVRAETRRAQRVARGLSATPIRVVLTHSLDLDPQSNLFRLGTDRLVYCPSSIARELEAKLGKNTTVIGLGAQVTIPALLHDLATRGVYRLMVEGGSNVLTQFLTSGLVDELRLATAGFFVGEATAPPLVGNGNFPWNSNNRLKLQEVYSLGDVVVSDYIAPERDNIDRQWMEAAFELSRQCPPTDSAYSVGAIIVAPDGTEIARGYTHEGGDLKVHAEEAALSKVGDRSLLRGATIYSTLEPCSKRVSRPKACAQWIRESGCARVVYGVVEPLFLQNGQGDELLRQAGIAVRHLKDTNYDAMFRQLNEPTFTRFKGSD
jgi:riboflavin-specific deaminase-like protein